MLKNWDNASRLRTAVQWAGIATLVVAACTLGYDMLSDQDAIAQNAQTGNDNVIIGGNSNGDVNSNNITIGELNIVVDEKLREIENSSQRLEASNLAKIIERLIQEGQLSITSPAAQSLIDEIIQLARKTPLKRDNIASQQFELLPGRAMFLFGGQNRIAFKHWSWRGYATLSFNGNEIKVNFGGSVPFNHNGARCQLILNGVNEQKNTADFTTFCGKG